MRHLVTGINCVASTAYREFMNTKRFYEKTRGRMYYHVVQSFSPEEELTAETAHEIALKLAEKSSGFEVLVCTHTDRDHLHSHLIINSVSAEDGRKYHSDKDNIQRIRMASDELCIGRSYAQRKGYRIIGESSDDNVSGMRFDRRGLNQCTEAVERGLVDAIIVKDLSRLGRHKTQTALFIDYLRQQGVAVLSVTENLNTLLDEDDLIIGVRGLMND